MSPDKSLYSRIWQGGQRLVTIDGKPVSLASLQPGSMVTVFPEDQIGAERAQTVLIRVKEHLLQLPEDRATWAPGGYVAYSRVCTHAGCPVGEFEAEQSVLLCPCHQSTFDVLRAAAPTGGPAARPLPQLPLYADADGTLACRWRVHRAARPRLLGNVMITETIARKVSRAIDSRLRAAKFVRSALNHVFPDHWSFMLGEIALYSFMVLVVTGTYLALFFHASSEKVIYHGSYHAAGRPEDLRRLSLRAAHQFRCSGRSAGSANAPLGGADLSLGDPGAYGAHLPDRRLPQAARDELADRADFVGAWRW